MYTLKSLSATVRKNTEENFGFNCRVELVPLSSCPTLALQYHILSTNVVACLLCWHIGDGGEILFLTANSVRPLSDSVGSSPHRVVGPIWHTTGGVRMKTRKYKWNYLHST